MSGELSKLQKVQVDLGETPDDIWGPRCDAALEKEKAAAQSRRAGRQEPAISTAQVDSAATRWPLEADAPSFYGQPDGSSKWEAEHLTTFPAPYALYMDGQLIRNIRCHKLVMQSLHRILTKIQQLYKTPEAIAKAGLDQYDGCYNFRSVRGASHLSMHAYGAAIDFDAAHNPLGATHGAMSREVVAIFKGEGWRWGGDYKGRQDWMHFEACR